MGSRVAAPSQPMCIAPTHVCAGRGPLGHLVPRLNSAWLSPAQAEDPGGTSKVSSAHPDHGSDWLCPAFVSVCVCWGCKLR